MNKIFKLFIVVVFFISCNNNRTERPSTAIETGSNFIKASLTGDFETAESLLLKDSINQQLFEAYKAYYQRISDDKKQGYKSASYQINKYLDYNDSTTIINYSNDFMKKPMEIKIIRKDKNWLVDFKYTYEGNLPID
jgi:hypothetical protein